MEKNMPQIIADTYKLIGQIGSGGGGIVYLAEHLRLNKKVVLKADKRALSAELEVLRREVDALKNLSHTYIPQVYDFIVEEGTVYTVMDYIDGESFDKPLQRGERFTQARMLEWARQLLDALAYLHSRPPHGILHADIKPANIMLTPQGDVRLIDFNIALALGAEGSIAVGRSFGYASPEHYMADYSQGDRTLSNLADVETVVSSDAVSDIETVLEIKETPVTTEDTLHKKMNTLDVRSDIFSLGATLYHMITGTRPARKATEVIPISPKECSASVIVIIAKMMDPDPNKRYQSAGEVLTSLKHLREDDKRTKRYKRVVIMSTLFFMSWFLIGGLITFIGLKQKEQLQNTYLLAEYSADALRSGNVSLAIDYALTALPEKRTIFMPPATAEAQKALTDALNIYDLSAGFKPHGTVELPSAPLAMEISPSGKTAAVLYAYNMVVFDTESTEIIMTLPAEPSALSEISYITDDVIVFAGVDGITAYHIGNNVELWTGKPATAIAASADGRSVAAVYKDEDVATVYDLTNGSIICEINFEGKHQRVTVNDSFANPQDNLFTLNEDGSLLGASFADGSLWVYNLNDREQDLELFDNTSGYTHFEGGFYEQYFAFSATQSENSVFAVIDVNELEQTGGFESTLPFGVEADASGIYVQTENLLVNIDPVTGVQTPLVTTDDDIVRFARSSVHTMITTADEYMYFDKNANVIMRHEKEYGSDLIKIMGDFALIGSLDTPSIRIMKFKNDNNSEVFTYDPTYQHDETRISADGKTIMLYSYNHFRLYGIGGEMLAEVVIPDANQVYDQQYRRDELGSRLEVIYNDGTIHSYSAEDGSLMYEITGEEPDLTLHEQFFTDTLRIESPLHGTPIAYDKQSGRLVRELEQDAYLTYVTQVEEYVITEYVTAEGKRYGLLLNDSCETLAVLPDLYDVVGNTLLFDYSTGSLRQSRIYHIDDLIELAQKEINDMRRN